MTEAPTPQQRLEAEKIAIDAMTDTTEQALASAALRLKIGAMKGEKGAPAELSRANKALADYREQQSASGDRFRNLAEASRWIITQGYLVSDRSVHNHSRYPGFPHKQKDGSYIKKQVEDYAAVTWENPTIGKPVSAGQSEDYKTGIQRETERKLKLKNDEEEGRLIRVEDEIRRRVNVIVGLKIAMENHRASFVQLLSERMRDNQDTQPDQLDEESQTWQRKALDDLVSEAGHIYSDIVLQVFAEIGKQGGVKL